MHRSSGLPTITVQTYFDMFWTIAWSMHCKYGLHCLCFYGNKTIFEYSFVFIRIFLDIGLYQKCYTIFGNEYNWILVLYQNFMNIALWRHCENTNIQNGTILQAPNSNCGTMLYICVKYKQSRLSLEALVLTSPWVLFES